MLAHYMLYLKISNCYGKNIDLIAKALALNHFMLTFQEQNDKYFTLSDNFSLKVVFKFANIYAKF